MNPRVRICLILGAAPLGGCGLDCGEPTDVEGKYSVFANVVAYEATNYEAFPSYMSPANGWAEWDITWNQVDSGPVIVSIDGQPFAGTGSWDAVECGHFALEFAGVYASEHESTHDFTAVGDFVVFGNQLEGEWRWDESWQGRGGEIGVFGADGQVSGSVVEE